MTIFDGQCSEIRALSSVEELWVKAYKLGTGSVVVGFQFEKSISLVQIKSAAEATAAMFPIISAVVKTIDKERHEFRILDVKNYGVKVEQLPWPLDEPELNEPSDLHKLVEHEFGVLFASEESESFEVCQIHVYTKNPASTFLMLRLHGSTLDRSSAVTVTQKLLSNLNSAVAGNLSIPAWRPEIPSPITNLIPKDVKSKGLLARGMDSMGYIASALKLALFPFSSVSSDFRKQKFATQLVEFDLGQEGTAEFLKACEQKGVNVFGAECAALLKAVAVLKELKDKKEEYGITSLINARSFLEPSLPQNSVGLYDLGLPLSHKVSEKTDFWDIARTLSNASKENVEKNKMFTEMQVLDSLFSYALKHPTMTPGASLRTALCSAYTDAPLQATWQDVGHLNLRESLGPFMSLHGIGPCMAILDGLKHDNLHVAIIYPAPLYSRSAMTNLASLVHENLLASAEI